MQRERASHLTFRPRGSSRTGGGGPSHVAQRRGAARVLSMTSIMSTTGRRTVGWQDPRLAPMMLVQRSSREAYIATSAKLWKMIGSPAYPDTEEAAQIMLEHGFRAALDAGHAVSGDGWSDRSFSAPSPAARW